MTLVHNEEKGKRSLQLHTVMAECVPCQRQLTLYCNPARHCASRARLQPMLRAGKIAIYVIRDYHKFHYLR